MVQKLSNMTSWTNITAKSMGFLTTQAKRMSRWTLNRFSCQTVIVITKIPKITHLWWSCSIRTQCRTILNRWCTTRLPHHQITCLLSSPKACSGTSSWINYHSTCTDREVIRTYHGDDFLIIINILHLFVQKFKRFWNLVRTSYLADLLYENIINDWRFKEIGCNEILFSLGNWMIDDYWWFIWKE